jgi:clorobiocin/coumermycin A biosynthesis protein CloN6/CouN6
MKNDLFLVHPPAYFDFRNRNDIYWPFFGTSSGTPITPLYEMFPVGFKSLKRVLEENGNKVDIVNLSTVMLLYPDIDLKALFSEVETRLFGIDLHWLVHVHGSLGVAEFLKDIHPDVPIVFGGISSTYYYKELMGYPFIDMVMRGYDTHLPMLKLMDALKDGDLRDVPNLVWKDDTGKVVENEFGHKPKTLTNGINFSTIPAPVQTLLPIRDVLTTENAGCAHNCGWCAGSRDSFRRINRTNYTVVQKDLDGIKYEMHEIAKIPGNDKKYNLYSLGTYSESSERFNSILDFVAESNLNTVMYDFFHLPSDEVTKKLAGNNPKVIANLSPMSHDVHVSRLSGRGTYTLDEMEAWIHKALEYGVYEINVWFLIGLQEQDEASVWGSVEYCRRLLNIFKGQRVIPFICPMTPFLDAASNYFEEPEKYGYKLFYKTVADHRRAMMQPSLAGRINYETKWLSREQLVTVSYEAVKRVFQMKGEAGLYPQRVVKEISEKIDDAREFTMLVHEINQIEDSSLREQKMSEISDEILRRNKETMYSGVRNPAIPIKRKIGGRWYDEVPPDWNEAYLKSKCVSANSEIVSELPMTEEALAFHSPVGISKGFA